MCISEVEQCFVLMMKNRKIKHIQGQEPVEICFQIIRGRHGIVVLINYRKIFYLYLVQLNIFVDFFFVIITKTWTWMMLLMSTWVKRSTYLSVEGFSLNAFILMINNWSRRKNKVNCPASKNLFRISKI